MSKARTMSSLLTSSGDVITTALDNVGAAITAGSGIALGDNDKATFGAGDDLQIYHDGSNNWVKGNNAGNNTVVVAPGGAGSVLITNSSGDNIITQQGDVAMLHHNGSSKLATTATGIDVTGNVIASGTVEPAGDTAAGDNAAIGYTAAEGLILTGQGSTSDITLKNDADAVVFTVPTGTDDILFPDNARAMFGAGSDLQIYHNGSHSYIEDAGTGNLRIRAVDLEIMKAGTGEYMIKAVADGAVTLYHDNAAKLATSATGVTITGTVNVTTVDLGNWTVTESGGVLFFATGGTNKMKLDASGNLTCVGNVTAYGSV